MDGKYEFTLCLYPVPNLSLFIIALHFSGLPNLIFLASLYNLCNATWIFSPKLLYKGAVLRYGKTYVHILLILQHISLIPSGVSFWRYLNKVGAPDNWHGSIWFWFGLSLLAGYFINKHCFSKWSNLTIVDVIQITLLEFNPNKNRWIYISEPQRDYLFKLTSWILTVLYFTSPIVLKDCLLILFDWLHYYNQWEFY